MNTDIEELTEIHHSMGRCPTANASLFSTATWKKVQEVNGFTQPIKALLIWRVHHHNYLNSGYALSASFTRVQSATRSWSDFAQAFDDSAWSSEVFAKRR